MQECVRLGNYSFRDHAHDEADAEDFTDLEVERTILSGKIREQQRDAATGEAKYIIIDLEGDLEVVAKLGPTGRLYIITVYTI